jgi:hypothetical protein
MYTTGKDWAPEMDYEPIPSKKMKLYGNKLRSGVRVSK